MQWLNTLGHLIKWSVELGEFDIEYRLRGGIKGQAVVDFVVEQITTPSKEKPKGPVASDEACWMLHADGSTMSQASGVGIILITPKGEN